MTRNVLHRIGRRIQIPAVIVVAVATWTEPARGQDTTRVPTGVELVARYNVSQRPLIAVRTASGAAASENVRQTVTNILERDLTNSDRFEMGVVPQRLAVGPIDYRAWNSLGVWYLIVPTLVQQPGGFQLTVELHDVVYGKLKSSFGYSLPPAASSQFRMAVHAVSDEVVRQITGQPGIAASRVVFSRRGSSGYQLLIVDSDGENVVRLAGPGEMIYSPTWSSDGSRLAYAIRDSLKVELRELNLSDHRTRTVSSDPTFSFAPAYSPDGRKLAFTATNASAAQEILEYDLERNCCARRLSRSARDDLNPTYSPDGRRIAFNSSRMGQPHIYVMSVTGGDATLISPYTPGEAGFYAAPDWSPTSDEVTFVGRSRGGNQVMVANVNRPGMARQITAAGKNDDPSWAPDGRHLVFARRGGSDAGLFVIDTGTGTVRKLVSGAVLMPDWSPVLLRLR